MMFCEYGPWTEFVYSTCVDAWVSNAITLLTKTGDLKAENFY